MLASRRISVALLLILFSGSGAAWALDYQINPGDVLDIRVYGQNDLSKAGRVSADGRVSFPLVGRVDVAGLTTFQAEDKLARQLADGYLVNPQVIIEISHYSKVYVAGQVKMPGAYELRGPLTVLEAITLAGGLTDVAHPVRSRILRRTADGARHIIKVDLKRIIENDDQTENIALKPGDVVIVGEQGRIFVTGEVNRPGSFPYKQQYSALQAIALAGGLTKVAAANGTLILRSQDGEQQILRVRVKDIANKGKMDKDVKLLPNDIVVVPESIF